MKRVNTFVAMGSEVQESKEKKVEGSKETTKGSKKKMFGRKRAGKEQHQESSKKQKVEEEKESNKVDEAELKKLLVIKKDEDIAIDAIPLPTKLPVIIDYKLLKEVKVKYGDTRPENEFERVLWGDLKVMFEPDKRSDVWRILQGYRVAIWKLIDSSRVHNVRRNLKIQKMNIKFRGGLLGLKRLHGFLEVTTAQVHNGNYAKYDHFDKLYDYLSECKPHVNASRAKRNAKNLDPLALVANSYTRPSYSHAIPLYSCSPQPYYVTYPKSVHDYDDHNKGEIQGDA
ncbi:hypothetical protein Tco_0819887 [Tanacetum coccineum]|uniref:Uncharacterized protein n=1 Tax=Tanacetum coccineum TaxID=301880 RepID=A0ABQ5A8V4_9ASTR